MKNFLRRIKKQQQLLLSLSVLLFFGFATTIFAVPPGSQYTAPAPLSPTCIPGSANCSVASAGGGMTIGDTITSATQGSVLFAGAAGVLTQDNAKLFWDDTPGNLKVSGAYYIGNDFLISQNTTDINLLVGKGTGSVLAGGAENVFVGQNAGNVATSASENVFIGVAAGEGNDEGNNGTFVGYQAGRGNTTGNDNTFIGFTAGASNTIGTKNIFIGYGAGSSLPNSSSSIAIGYNAQATANNQLVLGSNNASGEINDAYFGSGVTKISPNAITINATGGSGTNNAGAALIFAGGKGTDATLGGDILLKTADLLGTSNGTLQPLSTKMSISANTGSVQIRAGLSSGLGARVGGVLDTNTGTATNAGSGETDLYTTTLAANTLGTNGDSIDFIVAGRAVMTLGGSIKIYLGSTVIFSGTVTNQLTDWNVSGACVRDSATFAKCSVVGSDDNTGTPTFSPTVDYVLANETLANPLVLRVTATADTTAEIIGEMWRVEWKSNN